jgi:hypothetical protein
LRTSQYRRAAAGALSDIASPGVVGPGRAQHGDERVRFLAVRGLAAATGAGRKSYSAMQICNDVKRLYCFLLARLPYVMEVNRSFPAETVPEFIAYARANPGKINMASPAMEPETMSRASCSRR